MPYLSSFLVVLGLSSWTAQAGSLSLDLVKVWDGKIGHCHKASDVTHDMDLVPLGTGFYWRVRFASQAGDESSQSLKFSLRPLACVPTGEAFAWMDLDFDYLQFGSYQVQRGAHSHQVDFEFSRFEALLLDSNSHLVDQVPIQNLEAQFESIDLNSISEPLDLVLRAQKLVWSDGKLILARPVTWGAYRLSARP